MSLIGHYNYEVILSHCGGSSVPCVPYLTSSPILEVCVVIPIFAQRFILMQWLSQHYTAIQWRSRGWNCTSFPPEPVFFPFTIQCFTSGMFHFCVVVLNCTSLRMSEGQLLLILFIWMLKTISWVEWLSARISATIESGTVVSSFQLKIPAWVLFLWVNLKIKRRLLWHLGAYKACYLKRLPNGLKI